ncbi:MAG TPA: O-antigen ligase family protein, partial [Gemmataceae bacterium]|nr:O-antigen ligase family protein [Gemmataceae bacterium]
VVMIAQSRGGMLAMGVVGGMAFWLIPKTAASLTAFVAAGLLSIRLAGPHVRERFLTIFSDRATRDASAQSRLYLWRDALDATFRHPIFGVGPDHWPLVAQQTYGWVGAVNQAHSLWVQIAAELGVPGLVLLVWFYGVCVVRLWPLARGKEAPAHPWFPDAARMVIASLTGFAISAQFVSIKGLETPFYIALLGACVLKLSTAPAPAPAAADEEAEEEPAKPRPAPRGSLPAPQPVG